MSDLANNKKAYFNYTILETLEAGIELKGFEVKAVRANRANLGGSFATLKGGEIWLTNCDIPSYQPKNTPADYDSKRPRRLLVKKEEIRHLVSKMQSAGLTLVPLKLYNKNGRIKVELGLARGKKKADRRETLKRRAVEREVGRRLKS